MDDDNAADTEYTHANQPAGGHGRLTNKLSTLPPGSLAYFVVYSAITWRRWLITDLYLVIATGHRGAYLELPSFPYRSREDIFTIATWYSFYNIIVAFSFRIL